MRFVEVNIETFSEVEDDAVEAGIEPRRLQDDGEPIYFGLAGANAIDDRRAIPFFDPGREAFLEYELTRLIYELENPDKPRVALITSLPIDPAAAADPSFGAPGQPLFAIELGRLMQVQKLAPDFAEIPGDAQVLAIIHPWTLTPRQLYAVDQFILRRGRAFIALDPASMASAQNPQASPFDPIPPPQASTLEPLLARWGVALTRDVVLDLDGALPVNAPGADGRQQAVPQPLFFHIPADQRDHEDLMTAWLTRDINFGLAGGLSWSEGPGRPHATPLARTSGRTMRMAAAQALQQPSPFEVLRTWPAAGGRVETIALRLTGPVETAFPDGAPAPAPAEQVLGEGETAPPAQPASAQLRRSATPAQIVIVSDTDFLNDAFYVDPQSGAPAADNAAFALNAIDLLAGSNALVSLRSRAPAERRMEVVDDMEREAQSQIERRQEELQTELTHAQQQLAQLQAHGRGSGFFSGNLGAELTPEEARAIEALRTRVIEVRGELRSVGRNLRLDINRLQSAIVFVNVWLAPIMIAAVGLFLFWRRQRRGVGRAAR